jgi:hypothetical protein
MLLARLIVQSSELFEAVKILEDKSTVVKDADTLFEVDLGSN